MNRKERAQYAKKTLVQLSTDLTAEYSNRYSRSNLEYMRKFYLLYNHKISQPLAGGIKVQSEIPTSGLERGWLISVELVFLCPTIKIEEENEQNFYEIEAIQNNWRKRELIQRYNSAIYERIALSGNKISLKELGKKGQIVEKPTDALKHYNTVLEFWI